MPDQLPPQPVTEPTAVEPIVTPKNKKKVMIGAGIAVAIITAIVIIGAVVLATRSQNSTATNVQNNPNGFGYLAENTCPQSVFEENGLLRADANGGHYIITEGQKSWIQANCKDVSGLTNNNNNNPQNQPQPQPITPPAAVNETEPPLLLGSIGFKLEDYNPSTNTAGDIKFTKIKLPFEQLYSPFGQQDPRSPNDPSKKNPQPTVILPLGTKVLSLVTGEVVEVKQLYSGDMTVMVAKDKNSQYLYETEHIKNPTVKVGDKVTAGQVIGEVSDYDSHNNPGFGLIEIGILHATTDGGPPNHICPLNYLDPSIKDKTFASLTKLYTAWNQYLGKEIYKHSTFATPGCVVLDPVKG